MDGREPDRSTEPGGRPLTRRELRAARAAGTDASDVAPRGAGPAGNGERVEPAASGENGSVPPSSTSWPVGGLPRTEADSWEAAVDWALRGELPASLPPEPADLDDVRWEPTGLPHQPDGPDAPGHSAPEGPAGVPDAPDEAPDIDALARSLEPARLPDVPADERRPWDDSGLWGGVARDLPGAPTGTEGTERTAGPEGTERTAGPESADEPGQPRRVSVLGGTTAPGAGLGLPAPGGIGWLTAAPSDDADLTADLASGDPATDPGPGWAPAEVPDAPEALPTLDDLLATRPAPADGPAEWGWRGALRRVSGGLIAPGPGEAELLERASVASVQRPLDGPRTIVVVNPKGGAHKTTATLLIAATFGRHRGGYTLAWDNNETRGTLGWRSRHTHHSRTAVDLLEDLERFADPSSSRVGDLDAYVRSQAAAQFDVLASDEDAASAASVDAFAFRALHRTLLRFYRLLVIDTGNNMRASNWQAAIEAADQVVVVSTMREDTAQSAAWMLDALRATGHEEAVRRAVTVLSQPAPRIDAELTARLHDHFGRLTRTVLEVPYEPALVSGGPLDVDALSESTRRAWLHVSAAVADGL